MSLRRGSTIQFWKVKILQWQCRRITPHIDLCLSDVRLFCICLQEVKREPRFLGARRWSLFSRLYLRHFNELDHEFNSRYTHGPAFAIYSAMMCMWDTGSISGCCFVCNVTVLEDIPVWFFRKPFEVAIHLQVYRWHLWCRMCRGGGFQLFQPFLPPECNKYLYILCQAIRY